MQFLVFGGNKECRFAARLQCQTICCKCGPTASPILHALLQCDLAADPSRFSSPGIWVAHMAPLRLPRLVQTEPDSLRTSGENHSSCKKSNYLETTMLERPVLAESSLLAIPTKVSNPVKSFGRGSCSFICSSPQPVKVTLGYGPRHPGAETSHPHYALSKFLTHRSHEYNKMIVILHH